jgi:hypothetical protein
MPRIEKFAESRVQKLRPIVACIMCGRRFEQRRKDHRVCSNACRQANHRLKLMVNPPAELA